MSDISNEEKKIYVHRSELKLGIDVTAKRVASETFYESVELPDGNIKLTLLDMNDQPTGIFENVTPTELKKSYEYVPGYFKNRKTKEEINLEKKIALGKEHLEKKEYNSAEYEFDSAIKIDERNIVANVGKGEALVGQGEIEKAVEVFEKVSEFDELYKKENKHLFNSYGITLRKTKLFDQAIDTYKRAVKIDAADENILYNMARAYFDSGDDKKGIVVLKACLKINPDHSEAKVLMYKKTKS